MKKIILNKEMYNFLHKNIYSLKKVKQEGQDYIVSLDSTEIEKILDKLSDILVEKGLKDDDSPNDYGTFIEKLIDIFSNKYYNEE